MLTGDVEGRRDDGLPVRLVAWLLVPGGPPGLPVLTVPPGSFGWARSVPGIAVIRCARRSQRADRRSRRLRRCLGGGCGSCRSGASTGASNDLAGATDLATRMVREWGLSTELGPVGYGPEGPSRDNPFAGRPYAEQTQRSIDQEAARLLREAETRATDLLRGQRSMLRRTIDLLLERETITGTDLAAILGLPDMATPELAGVGQSVMQALTNQPSG